MEEQPVSLQIFHLGGQRKEKHNNHIMVGSIMNWRGAIFFTNTEHKGVFFLFNGGVILDSAIQTSPHLLTVPRIVRMENQIGRRATARKMVSF